METISCGKLSMGVVGLDCNNPLIMGIKPNAIIINHNDIDIEKTTISANGIITKLVLKEDGAGSTRKGYLAQTLNDGISTNVAFAKGTYSNGWDQNFTLRLFDNTPKVKKFIDELSKSRVVVIIENNHVKYADPIDSEEKKGETVYEAYGFYTGLELNEATRDSTDADTKGGYVLTCGCDESSKEPSLPITIFNDSLAATKIMVEGLV
jgi:hypothetical protein